MIVFFFNWVFGWWFEFMCCKDYIILFLEVVLIDVGGNLGLVLVVGSMKIGCVGKGI